MSKKMGFILDKQMRKTCPNLKRKRKDTITSASEGSELDSA